MALVKRFDVSAWRFGGWGMYSTPTRAVLLSVAVAHDGKTIRIRNTALPSEIRGRIRTFNRHRDAFGPLLRPDAIGEALLDATRRVREVILTVDTFQVAAGSAMIEKNTNIYRYERTQ
jgi:hypothetical protein